MTLSTPIRTSIRAPSWVFQASTTKNRILRLRFETDEWRIPLDAATIGLPQTLISEDEPRTQYINVAIDEYDVTETANGEWLNYTKTFPSGIFHIYGRFGSEGGTSFTARMDKVTGNRTSEDQSTLLIGVFLGAGGGGLGYECVQLTDDNGSPVTLTLDGIQTLRVTAVEGGYNVNYYVLVETDTSLSPPNVVITSPPVGSGFTPGADVRITADASDADGSVTQVEFFATSPDGNELALGQVTDAPYEVIWQNAPEGIYTLTAAATDDSGLTAAASAIRRRS